tara:strand:- start:479 stop:1852 length:1374 start_codon:yes stop_codon:yes gene_type:complete
MTDTDNGQKKPKLLCWNDFVAPTGFANVAKNLLAELHHKFDIEILGINYHGHERYDTSKWFVYSINPVDPLGLKRLPKILKSSRPDIIFLFQDVFHIEEALKIIKKEAPETRVIIYFPVDGSPFSAAWKQTLLVPDAVITYSDFAIDTILQTFPDIPRENIHKLYHGVDFNVFFQIEEKRRRMIRIENGWEGKFVVVNVNRFQPRKAIPLTTRAFALFQKGYKICNCGNWYIQTRNECDLNNCSKDDVVEVRAGHDDVLLYLHMQANEPTMGPGRANLLQAHLLNAGFVSEDVPRHILLNASRIYEGEVPEEVVNNIYNAADINISTAFGEGCGLSLIESAAGGTTSIAPCNSAIPEMLGNTGHLIPNVSHINMAMDNAHMRPVVDVRKVVEALETEYQKWVANGRKKVINEAAIERTRRKFSWPDKQEYLENILLEEAAKPKHKPRVPSKHSPPKT